MIFIEIKIRTIKAREIGKFFNVNRTVAIIKIAAMNVTMWIDNVRNPAIKNIVANEKVINAERGLNFNNVSIPTKPADAE